MISVSRRKDTNRGRERTERKRADWHSCRGSCLSDGMSSDPLARKEFMKKVEAGKITETGRY